MLAKVGDVVKVRKSERCNFEHIFPNPLVVTGVLEYSQSGEVYGYDLVDTVSGQKWDRRREDIFEIDPFLSAVHQATTGEALNE